MAKHLFIVLILAGGLTSACGDKLDPIVDTPDSQDSNTGTQPSSDSNMPSTGTTTTTGTTTGDTNTTTTTPTTGTTGTTKPPSTGNLCGTNATSISYATHIAPLVSTYCSNCHGSGGSSPNMTTYNNTKSGFVNFGAKDQIDAMAMPQGARLTTNQICVFDAWVTGNYAP